VHNWSSFGDFLEWLQQQCAAEAAGPRSQLE
jgi:hypothetical protein